MIPFLRWITPWIMYACESWIIKKAEDWRIDAFELWCWRGTLKSLGLQGDQTSPSERKSTLNINWQDWHWSWSSNTLATWHKELTHWKRPWCWERLRTKGEGGDRGWDGWMASLTQWTWVWMNSGRQWRTEKPGVLQFMRSQRVGHDLVTEQRPEELHLPWSHFQDGSHPEIED